MNETEVRKHLRVLIQHGLKRRTIITTVHRLLIEVGVPPADAQQLLIDIHNWEWAERQDEATDLRLQAASAMETGAMREAIRLMALADRVETI